MATQAITLNIDTTLLPTVVAALCWQGMYQTSVPDPQNPGQTMPNPVTPNQFAKQQLINYIRNTVVGYQQGQAQQSIQPPSASLIN